MNRRTFALVIVAATLTGGLSAASQSRLPASYDPPNDLPNPYKTIANWGKLPAGRTWGSTAGVAVAPDGSIWAYDRCGENSCANSNLDPILHFDSSGKLIGSFGAGLLLFPHGFALDRARNVYVTDGQGNGTKGHQVFKFSPQGKLLMTLGKAGVAGAGNDELNQPSAVAVARNGDIYIGDGHSPTYGNARVMKFSSRGKFLGRFGSKGSGPGEFMGVHSLAFDSKGRLFVADRTNNRIQIFDARGKLLGEWKQFGRPSAVFIDQHDMLYVSDSESREDIVPGGNQNAGYGYHPGCRRGIRIGSVKDGKVIAFIPDPAGDPKGSTSTAEGIAVDRDGNIYGAEVGPRDLKKYAKNQLP